MYAQKEERCLFFPNCCSLRHSGHRDQEAQGGAIKAFAADCSLQQGMERRCFHSEGEIPHRGKPEPGAAVWIPALPSLPATAAGHEHPLFVRTRDKLQDFFKSFQYICERE